MDNNEFYNSMMLVCPDELTKPRFVPKSGLSRDEAREICRKNSVIWGAD